MKNNFKPIPIDIYTIHGNKGDIVQLWDVQE